MGYEDNKPLDNPQEVNSHQLKVELVEKTNDTLLKNVLALEKACFPEHWMYEDAEEYFKKLLENEKNLKFILNCDGKIVGYSLIRPHNDVFEEVQGDDPDMKEDSERYYVETFQILPEYQKKHLFSVLVKSIIEETAKRNRSNFSMHARVNNGLSKNLQLIFGNQVSKVRRIENWTYYNGEEPCDYMEININRS